MADILKIIITRRWIRKFKNKTVERNIIGKIITAGAWAPSRLNNQPWRFVIIES